MNSLKIIFNEIKELKRKNRKQIDYFVPPLWINENSNQSDPLKVKPYDLFLDRIEAILNYKNNQEYKYKDKSIYNLFVRYSSAYDHNGDGKINIEPDEFGFRETGTFLKSILILPFIKSLGINTIYLLPVTSIGIDGRKGNLGSPYAIRNPYKIEESLKEDFLEADINIQFKAFIEAAHKLGMKVICEFVFRTAAIDSDLALDHPDWFYWIKNNIKDRTDKKSEKHYGPPIFNNAELKKIKEMVEKGDFKNLPEPHEIHKNMFAGTPQKVARVENKVLGVYKDLNGKIKNKNNLRIPGAFADWPPDDNQPVWSDVTYLKLYENDNYNYIAYNTIRMYDEKLAKPKNKKEDLWQNIEDIIPYYQNEFDIDGVMIDMGHALPDELLDNIISKAKSNKSDFEFWEENFILSENNALKYDASLGYMPFDAHNPWKVRDIIKMFEDKKVPIDFFATPETHNTKRAASREGGAEFAIMSYALNKLLPTYTFVLSGFEFSETTPVNTGLLFSDEEIEKYPPEKLPLFSVSSINWNNDNHIINDIRKINSYFDNFIDENNSLDNSKIYLLETSHYDTVSLIRRIDSNQKEIFFAGNYSPDEKISFEVDLLNGADLVEDFIKNKRINAKNGKLFIELKPFEFILGELKLKI